MNQPTNLPIPELFAKLETYGFECEGGSLTNCVHWQQLKAHMNAGVPCPQCGAGAICRAQQGTVAWLHCFACKTNFVHQEKHGV